jgi:hypothetical protein
VFHADIVVTPLLFVHAAALAAVCPITTTHDDWYPLTDTPKSWPPTTRSLPTRPEALGEVVATVRESATAFSVTRGDAVAQRACSRLQPAEGSFGFEIIVHGVYIVLGFCLFLGSGGNA